MNHSHQPGLQQDDSSSRTGSEPAPGSHRQHAGRSTRLSAWRRRILVIVLSLMGLATATTLALFQAGVSGAVWEPFFGDGSRRVLTSSFSEALPIPDASLGAAAYLLEAVLESIGGTDRWRERPWIVAAAGAVAVGLGSAALGLIATQALVVGAFCTLCLCSAAISLLVASFTAAETTTAVRVLWARHHTKSPHDRAATVAAERNEGTRADDDRQPTNLADPSPDQTRP